MNLRYSIIAVVLGIGLASLAILPNNQIQRSVVAQSFPAEPPAAPAGEAQDSLPVANETGELLPAEPPAAPAGEAQDSLPVANETGGFFDSLPVANETGEINHDNLPAEPPAAPAGEAPGGVLPAE